MTVGLTEIPGSVVVVVVGGSSGHGVVRGRHSRTIVSWSLAGLTPGTANASSEISRRLGYFRPSLVTRPVTSISMGCPQLGPDRFSHGKALAKSERRGM